MYKISCITCNEKGESHLVEKEFPKSERNGMILSEQIEAQNFRIRESAANYKTTWHLAGDPTLIIILKGVLRITLQNMISKDFEKGEMFIAADNLKENIHFDQSIHGHKAEVIGNESLLAIHIKLTNFVL